MRNQDKPSYATHHDWHSSQLQYDSSLLYTYTVTYHGFAASFDSNQADSHTTRARKFLDLNTEFDSHNTQVLNQALNDIIIGVFDTSVWPESKSFNNSGLPNISTPW